MPYRIIMEEMILIKYKIIDFTEEPIREQIDVRTVEGSNQYQELFRKRPPLRRIIKCLCRNCIMLGQSCFSEIRRAVSALLEVFNERDKRLFIGFLSKLFQSYGKGFITSLTKKDYKTIRRGRKEINYPENISRDRVRATGGGRPSIQRTKTKYLSELHSILEDDTAGDPMSEKKWVRKDIRWIKKVLSSKGVNVALGTIHKTLKSLKISLKKNNKSLATKNHPDRDAQFEYIKEMKNLFLEEELPFISLDKKKTELIGNLANKGKTRRKQAYQVFDHDFPSLAVGRILPNGIYDLQKNEAYIYNGTSKDTSEFVVDCLSSWWKEFGEILYPDSSHILILCDSGGANGYRRRGWKWFLQENFVNRYNITVTVCHYPVGASKYNPIERKVFSFISKNWEGEPLTSYEKALGFMRSTTTTTGLSIKASLIDKDYKKGIKISDEQMMSLNLSPHFILPKWNYTLSPSPSQTNFDFSKKKNDQK